MWVEFYPDDPTIRPSSSQEDEVTVNSDPRPANDLFANAVPIEGPTTQPNTAGWVNGAATPDPGTPPTALPSTAGLSVWYRWVAPSNGSFEFAVQRDNALTDLVLRAFEGTTLADLRTLAENDDDGGPESSRVGINAAAGHVYYLLVDAYSFATMGTFSLTWGPTSATPAPTATTLTASSRERVVTLTSRVDDPGSTANPVGYVEFFEGTTRRGTVRVTAASNRAVRTLTFVPPGVHTYRAVFVPDDYLLAQSTSPNRPVTTTKNATLTTLTAPTRATAGARPTVTATVRFATLSTNPTGSVRFTLNGRVLRTVPLSNRRASLRLPALAAGTARVVARYLGRAGIAPSQATRSITVRR